MDDITLAIVTSATAAAVGTGFVNILTNLLSNKQRNKQIKNENDRIDGIEVINLIAESQTLLLKCQLTLFDAIQFQLDYWRKTQAREINRYEKIDADLKLKNDKNLDENAKFKLEESIKTRQELLNKSDDDVAFELDRANKMIKEFTDTTYTLHTYLHKISIYGDLDFSIEFGCLKSFLSLDFINRTEHQKRILNINNIEQLNDNEANGFNDMAKTLNEGAVKYIQPIMRKLDSIKITL